MESPPAYVLAGGKSSRFGSDKARAQLDDTPLILRVANVLRTTGAEPLAVADTLDKYADLALPTIADRRPGLGPLAGLEAALAHRLDRSGEGWLLLASCDLAGLKSAWLETLLYHLRTADREQSHALAFRADFWQPFPAAYHTNLLPLVSQLLDDQTASFQRLLSHPRSNATPLPLPPNWPATPQVNTPEELMRFQRNRSNGGAAGGVSPPQG